MGTEVGIKGFKGAVSTPACPPIDGARADLALSFRVAVGECESDLFQENVLLLNPPLCAGQPQPQEVATQDHPAASSGGNSFPNVFRWGPPVS